MLKHLSHTTDNLIGNSGVESISGALQSNTSLTSLDISCVVLITHPSQTQQITVLDILVLKVFREHFNQTLHSNHLILQVCCVIHMFHTTDNHIGDFGSESGDSGVDSISGALQSNTSLTSLDIASVVLITHLSQTQQITILDILVLKVFREHFNQTLHSNHLIFQVCCVIHMFHTTDNHIGDSGAESISRALQSNTSLTSLNISGVTFCSMYF